MVIPTLKIIKFMRNKELALRRIQTLEGKLKTL